MYPPWLFLLQRLSRIGPHHPHGLQKDSHEDHYKDKCMRSGVYHRGVVGADYVPLEPTSDDLDCSVSLFLDRNLR